MSEKCPFWYEPNKECMKMTKILQDNGVIGFHATMNDQKRSCEGISPNCGGCYFIR
jgi:hypothetical protein